MAHIYNVAIIGAGASGLMLSSTLQDKNHCLIEANDKIGAKLRVCGGGKCNITNKHLSSNNYFGDKKFLENLFKQFSNKELIDFLHSHGIKTKIDNRVRDGQYFLNSSIEIISLFEKLITKNLFLNTEVLNVTKVDEIYLIKCKNREFLAKNVVVATGGISYAQVGGVSDIGYKIAQHFGLEISKTTPALVGFTVQKEQFWFKNLSGVSLLAKIKVDEKEFLGNILFTHKGISGPIIMNSSLYWQKGSIEINFLPNIKFVHLLKDKAKQFSTVSNLPKRFVKEFLESLDLEDKPMKNYNADELEKLKTIKNYQFSPAGTLGFQKAEVTKGGVLSSFIDNNFECKSQKGLFFIGEVLDITGELGGYNLQFAFSSAVVCGVCLGKKN